MSVATSRGARATMFHPSPSGRGYATEAAQRLLQLAFDDLDLHRVIGRLDARNEASARLMERLAMRREACFVENQFNKGRWDTELVYAILRREWRAASAVPAASQQD